MKLWTLDSKQPRRTLEGHTSTIRRIAFSADEDRLATGSFDRRAKLWDVNSGRLLSTFSGHKDSIWGVVIRGDNGQDLMTAGNDETIKIWSAGSYHQGIGNRVAVAPDGTRLATTSRDGTVRVWSLSGQQKNRYDDGGGATRDAVFYPDSIHLAIVSEDGALRIRDTSTGKVITRLLSDDDLYAVAINPAATLLAAAGVEKVFLLNPETGQVITSTQVHQGQVRALAFHPTQNLLASGGQDGLVQIIDLKDYRITRTLMSFPIQTIEHLAFSPAGQYLAAASGNSLVTVWEVKTGQEVFKISGHGDVVSAVAFTADSKYLITGSADRTVKIWAISAVTPGTTPETPRLVLSHPAPVNGLALTPDNSILVTIGDDRRVRFFPFLLDIKQMLALAQRRITSQP